ncbi:BspA family leucine-rich repeat surface protein [Bifidobacterium sp. ESL0790]|uniref:BspA family leucine-rich repeat surface protein n=1 Tax=Bifidobacterium sp. ESL0790 TaxID=2983233 RepID=UPI0023F90BEB|nr:BspA family leucine-rich repeat surface protein [Bifidobacterium sp. ESL0790]WEV72846.1 BspA family leucine-rich repeat surface protein [Bifidobacterium sp. ESL0790]
MTKSNPTVGPQDATCSQPGEHTWGTLTWNEHVDGNDCVLELESGQVPDHTGTNADPGVPWAGHSSVTKVAVDNGVSLGPTGGRYLFTHLTNLKAADVGNLDTSQATDLFAMFWNDSLLEIVTSISNWDTSSVTNMNSLFNMCVKLVRVDLSPHDGKWDTSAVTDMTNMFVGDAELISTGAPGLSIPAGATQTHMFDYCAKLVRCSQPGDHPWSTLTWNEHIEEDGSTVTCVLELKAGLVPDHTGTNAATTVPWTNDTSITKAKVDAGVSLGTTGGRYLFTQLTNLKTAEVGNLDTSQTTDLFAMFWNDTSLETVTGIENWDTHLVTNMNAMFHSCTKLTKVNLNHNGNQWDTDAVTDMTNMFWNDGELTSIGVPGLEIPSGATQTNMFYNCLKLVRCSQPGDHPWSTLTWNEHLEDDGNGGVVCVLELKSGRAPDHTGTNTSTTVPWTNDTSVTKAKVDAGVSLGATGGRYLFTHLTNLKTADVGDLDTSQANDLFAMFWNDSNLETVTGIENWDTHLVTNMNSLFNMCPKLTKVDLSRHGSQWDTDNVTDMTNMFVGDGELYSIGVPGLEIHNTTTQTHMFDYCVKLIHCGKAGDYVWGTTDPLHWKETMTGTFEDPQCILELEHGTIPDTGTAGDSPTSPIPWNDPGVSRLVVDPDTGQGPVKLTSGWGIFDGHFLPGLRTADVIHLDTSQSTLMGWMFHDQPLLTTIDGIQNWDTSHVTNMYKMFLNCPKLTNLNLKHDGDQWNTHNVTNMASMFNGASSLTNLDLSNWDTSALTNMTGIVTGDASLEILDMTGWDTSGITDMSNLFQNLPKLKTIRGIGGWDTSHVTNMNSMFQGDAALVGEATPGTDPHPTPNGRTLDLSAWNTSHVTDMRSMFKGCSSLESLDIHTWDMRTLGSYDEFTDDHGRHLLNQSQMIANCPHLYRVKVGPNIDFSYHEQFHGAYSCVPHQCIWYTNNAHASPVLQYGDGSDFASEPAEAIRDTPVYKNSSQSAWMYGASYRSNTNNMTLGRFPTPEWIYLITTHYSGACSDGEAMPTTVMCPTVSNPGYRLTGWKNGENGTYKPGSYVPYSVPGNTLTPVWSPLTPPGVSKATPHAGGSLTVGGGMPGGTLTGDTYTATPYAAASGGTAGASSTSATVTEVTASAPNDGSWTADYSDTTNPYPADTVGTGTSMWFTSKLTQADNTTSGESARKKLTVDTVAPGLQSHIGGRTASSGPGVQATIKGMVRTSGDSVAQPGNTVEAGDRITITWPDGTTSGAKADGSPLPKGSNGSIVSAADGSFAIDIPSGQALDGSEATVKVWDNADGDGTDPNHPAGIENKANMTSIGVKLTPPTVDKLPLTGHHWQHNGLIAFAVAVVLAITTGAYAQRKRQRH